MRLLLLAALASLLSACESASDQFIAGRLLDTCNGAWNVCTTTAGCYIGNAYYLEGRFPGTRRFIVHTEGQAALTLSIFLTSEGALGETLQIQWNDAKCGKTTDIIDSKAFFQEADTQGWLSRTQNMYQSGDHLIEVTSDSTAGYLLKVDVKEPQAQ